MKRSLLNRLTFGKLGKGGGEIVPMLRLEGPIGKVGPGRSGLSLEGVREDLERAFKFKKAAAVVIVINSPGGSPVQSALIADRIRALAVENDRKVIAFVEDVAASGGYWLALAADEIIASHASIIGSIGVISAGFGFVGLLERAGIERRVYSAGDHKGMLDAFRPENEADVEHLKSLQAELHELFKSEVKKRRGDCLKGDETELFSGLFWTGGKALDLGLVDLLGSADQVLRERFGEDVQIRRIGRKRGWRLPIPGLDAAVAKLPSEMVAVLEERSLWQRFGL